MSFLPPCDPRPLDESSSCWFLSSFPSQREDRREVRDAQLIGGSGRHLGGCGKLFGVPGVETPGGNAGFMSRLMVRLRSPQEPRPTRLRRFTRKLLSFAARSISG